MELTSVPILIFARKTKAPKLKRDHKRNHVFFVTRFIDILKIILFNKTSKNKLH